MLTQRFVVYWRDGRVSVYPGPACGLALTVEEAWELLTEGETIVVLPRS